MIWKKIFVFVFYPILLWVCSAVLGSFLNDVTGGPPGNIRNDMPFFTRWMESAYLVGWLLIDLWYVFVFFGGWIAVFPPRGWRMWLAFSLSAVGAGLLASHEIRGQGVWDHELADHNIVSPPAGPMAVYATSLSCVTALLSAMLCALVCGARFGNPRQTQCGE